MSAPKTFENDTWLYHAAYGARLFLAGAEHPGEGWFDRPQAEDAGPTIELDPGVSSTGGATRIAELERDIDEQKTKFDTAWGELTKAKRAVEDENADLRRDLTSRDEDIRQLQAQLDELTAPPADTSEAKPAAGKPSK